MASSLRGHLLPAILENKKLWNNRKTMNPDLLIALHKLYFRFSATVFFNYWAQWPGGISSSPKRLDNSELNAKTTLRKPLPVCGHHYWEIAEIDWRGIGQSQAIEKQWVRRENELEKLHAVSGDSGIYSGKPLPVCFLRNGIRLKRYVTASLTRNASRKYVGKSFIYITRLLEIANIEGLENYKFA